MAIILCLLLRHCQFREVYDTQLTRKCNLGADGLDLNIEFYKFFYLGILFHLEQLLSLFGPLSLSDTRLVGAQRILQQIVSERQDVFVCLQCVDIELERQLDFCERVWQHGFSDYGVLELSYLRVGEDDFAVVGSQLEGHVLNDQVD